MEKKGKICTSEVYRKDHGFEVETDAEILQISAERRKQID